MSNVTTTAQPSPSATPVSPLIIEESSPAGVRKVLEAHAEREVHKVRWGAIIAGIFLAGGTKILLLLLGKALGVPGATYSAGPTPFTVAVGLIALYVGGCAAAKLSGAIRRSHGVFAGTLTWSTGAVTSILIAIAMGMAPKAQDAWFTFGGALLSLMAAMLGGARGSVAGGMMRGYFGARRRALRRRDRETEKGEEGKE